MKRHFLSLSLLSVLFISTGLPAVAQAQDASIRSIKGTARRANAVGILSEGQTRPVDIDTPLQQGDVLQLLDTNATVEIILESGKRVVLKNGSHQGNRFMITREAELGVSDRLMAFIRRVFKPDAARRAIAAGRGVRCSNTDTDHPLQFSVPALASGTANLAEGTRDLFIPWQGGLAPFEITLRNKVNGKTVAQASGHTGCEVAFEKLALLPGFYELRLQDAKRSTQLVGNIRVVDRKNLPSEPAELTQEQLPQDIRAYYYALWLAAEDNGAWTLEAIQQLSRPDAQSPTAQRWLNQWGGGK